MTTESLPRDVDTHIVTLLTKLSSLKENHGDDLKRKVPPMFIESRSLELWRAVAVECFATFLFSFIVSGTFCFYSANLSLTYTWQLVLPGALAAGCAVAAVSLIFGPVSGGHINPAVSVSFALSRKISPLRAALYIAAQCGGGIAGAGMLHGVCKSTPSFTKASDANEKLVMEIVLSIFVILAHYAADSPRSLPAGISAKPAGVLAGAYTASTLVSGAVLNPARALGLAFLCNKWDTHWVYWIGPLAASVTSALLHEYVLSPRNSKESRDLDDGDDSSLRSDEDNYDDLDKPTVPKYSGAYATYRPVAGASASLYNVPPASATLERVESIYGGTKSLYCKSPPLTRANLNRSQSVYAKSTSGIREGLVLPKPGPLVPAQSLYPMRIAGPSPGRGAGGGGDASQNSQGTHNHNSTNQNMQNQLQQCTQSIYGISRGVVAGNVGTRENGIYGVSAGSGIYGRAPAPSPQQLLGNNNPGHSHHQGGPPATPGHPNQESTASNGRRPESMYGHLSRRSDDSAYGSYQSSNRGNYGKTPGPPPNGQVGPPQYRDQQPQGRPSPVGPVQMGQGPQGNFPRNSPNPPY